MAGETKKIAIIGANKEGLKLLPILLWDKSSSVCLIADSNRDAMLFKLNELGYRLAPKLNIKVTNELNDLKNIAGLDTIINALQDPQTEKFLEAHEFRDVEKLGPLSARLIWGIRPYAGKGIPGIDKADEQTNLLQSLREIVDAVRLTIDRKELLSVVLKLATESTGAERGSIMLKFSEDDTLRVEIAKGMDEEVVRKIRVRPGEGVSGRVFKEGKPLIISGRATLGEFERPMTRTDVKSSMCVPLVVGGEIIGVVNVSSSESAHIFTDEDLKFLQSLAGLAAEVIQRSNEYERHRLDAAKFSFWKEVDTVMSSSLPLDKRLNAVAKKLSELIIGLTCFVYLYDDDRKRLFLKAASIRDSKGLGYLSLRPGEGIEGTAVEAMKDVFLVDRTEEGATKRAYIALPMVSHNQFVGVLNFQIASQKGISAYQEEFLKDIRSLVAEGVYKHRQREKEQAVSRRMFAVDEAGLETISIKDLKKLYTIVATTPAAILGAEGALLRVRQQGASRYITVATYGLDDKNVREYFLPIEKETVMEVLRKGDAVAREFSEEASPYIRSTLSRPLMLNNEIAAVLTLFNKTGEGTVYPCGFSKADTEILARFSVYAEKALQNISGESDKLTFSYAGAGVAPPLTQFKKRVEEELNRARRFEKGLVLSTVRFAGIKDALPHARKDFEDRVIEGLKRKMRNFDVAVKLNEETYGFLLLDTNEKVQRLLPVIEEVIASNELYSRAFSTGKAQILFGYAMFPDDGDSFAELFSKASNRVLFERNKPLKTELYK
ncbi:MAG: GAF domain-containing protein [Deltaproteobacteria bacterium]